MNRIWWDTRPPHLREVVSWWDWHAPTLGRFVPFRCRECHIPGGRHTLSCSIGKDWNSRDTVWWRVVTILTVNLVLACVAGITLGVQPWWPPATWSWWVAWVASVVVFVSLPFLAAKFLRDWWAPRHD